ncbi:TPA: GDP-mannose pyrophosphatase [Kluyvera ascorbata]|nr:GDP-mannose pyrophosphatase [Kluyvera ascorbata]
MHEKNAKIRIIKTDTLSDDWYVLKKYTFELQRQNSEWQRQSREVYDRGNGATILLYNRERRTVILTRQFRFPTYMNGYPGYLIETAAGLLDNMDAESRIKAEAEEETGFRLANVQKVLEAFMSPGSVTEKLHFFIAEYTARDKVSTGGGLAAEGEDIEVLEMAFDEALAAIDSGAIVDGKTIMLLYYVAHKGIL